MTWTMCSRRSYSDARMSTPANSLSSRIGLQTFTVRRFMKSPAQIEVTFARLAEMGITAVELAYVKLRPEYIDALERAGRQHGISFCSSQIPYDFLAQQRDWVARFHAQLECRITAVSVLPFSVIRGGRDKLLDFARKLDALGRWYKEQGMQLCFHHHDFEFRRYGDSTGLDVLMANTGADTVGLELDTYWALRGGRAPHDLVNDLGGRVKVVHLRDYMLRWKYFELLPKDAELGAGNLDLARIIQACCEQRVELLAVEQDTKTPFDSLARSLEHVRALGYAALLGAPDTETQHDSRPIQT